MLAPQNTDLENNRPVVYGTQTCLTRITIKIQVVTDGTQGPSELCVERAERGEAREEESKFVELGPGGGSSEEHQTIWSKTIFVY